MSKHKLTLGSLDLSTPGVNSYWFETLVDGFSLGSPEAQTIIQASLMLDGEDERWVRDSNREVTFTIVARGGDLISLSNAERALRLETYRRNEMSWRPPDGLGATTVFTVVTSRFNLTTVQPTWDLKEAGPGTKERAYEVTLRCLPHGRAVTPVTQTLTPAVVTPTVVDDCVSATNWSSNGAYPASLSATMHAGEDVIAATFTSVSFGLKTTNIVYSGTKPTTAFVGLDVNWDSFVTDRTVTLQGAAPQSSEVVTLGTGTYTRYWFATPAAAATWTFNFSQTVTTGGVTVVTWRIANLVSSADVGGSGVMSVDTLGSVRSVGSVTVARASAITWALIYADPQLDQFSPSVSATWKYGRAGTYVVYAASGSFVANDVVTLTFTDSAGRAVTTAQTKLNAEVAALPWQPLGVVNLGGFRDGLIGAQTVTATKNGSSTTLPTLRLFRIADDTTLTYLAGVSGTELVVQAPSVDYPVGGYWMNGVDVHGKAVSPGFPVIEIPRTALYVEANNSASAPVASTLGYYPAAHTYSAV